MLFSVKPDAQVCGRMCEFPFDLQWRVGVVAINMCGVVKEVYDAYATKRPFELFMKKKEYSGQFRVSVLSQYDLSC